MSTNRSQCPLCDFAGERAQVYRHLQTGHLKRELSRELLAADHDPADWVGAKYCEPGDS